MWPKNLSQVAGLGLPLVLAVGTYRFFSWLDRSASPPAILAISGWLKAQPYQRVDLTLAIEATFDRL